jgi:D-amino-acid dehydrogenase
VIVGGGLIGLCTAHVLLREGHRVTIVERDHLGAGAATGNAGELTPQQVAPLASPHIVKDVVAGVLTNSSYLSMSLPSLPQLAGFGVRFLRASASKNAARGEAALAQFANGIFPALDRLTADGIDTSGGGSGYLMTCSNEDELLASHRKYGQRAARGWGEAPGPILRGDKLREQEPSLAPGVIAGYMLPAERSLDPVTFVDSLIRHVGAAGATILTGITVQRILDGATVFGQDSNGDYVTVSGDRVVVAAGAWSSPILQRSGIASYGIVSGKGYSYTVPVERMPKTLVHSLDRHCVAIPMHGRLRIVGMMEFDQKPEQLNPARLEVLTRAARGLIAGADWERRTEEWVGARPMTADGMPLLGTAPSRPEIIVAAGHNMHGLSLGPITAEVIADLVAGRTPTSDGAPLDLKPFAVRR